MCPKNLLNSQSSNIHSSPAYTTGNRRRWTNFGLMLAKPGFNFLCLLGTKYKHTTHIIALTIIMSYHRIGRNDNLNQSASYDIYRKFYGTWVGNPIHPLWNQGITLASSKMTSKAWIKMVILLKIYICIKWKCSGRLYFCHLKSLVVYGIIPDRQTDRYFIDRKEKSLQTYLS